MRVYQVVISTYESKPYPVVTHVFTGATKEEAWHYVESHLGTCSFFRGCAEGHFADFKCRNVLNREGWTEMR